MSADCRRKAHDYVEVLEEKDILILKVSDQTYTAAKQPEDCDQNRRSLLAHRYHPHFQYFWQATMDIHHDLPALPEGGPWPANTLQAYHILRDMYRHSRRVLCQEENEPVRLNVLWNEVFHKAIPMLEALHSSGFPDGWIEPTTHLFGALAVDLKGAETAAEGRCETDLQL